jgi:hypothetical protein
MKKWKIFSALLVALLFGAGIVLAGDSHFDSVVATPSNGVPADSYGLQVQNSSGTAVFKVDDSGNVTTSGTMTSGTGSRNIPLPILTFGLTDGALLTRSMSVVGTYISPTTTYVRSIVFPSSAGVSPVETTFRIPDDYSAGGSFVLMAYQSGASGYCRVGFDYRTNTVGTALATTATTQPEFVLLYNGITPTQVSLTPTMSLVAGQWVTLRLWRGATSTGTDTLHIPNVSFIYISTR